MSQLGILAPVPKVARYFFFEVRPGVDPRATLRWLAENVADDVVVGLGQSLLSKMGQSVEGLRNFPALTGPDVAVPATPCCLWLWLHGEDRGELVHRSRFFLAGLDASFSLTSMTDGFRYRDGRDLSGYIDGTENPTGDDANAAALVQASNNGLDGSSFVAVQRWVHDLDTFDSMTPQLRDETIGRRIADNEEIDDAPKSAHVKRTAQEDFSPEAFVLRRSMPWARGPRAGLVFVAFGHSLDAFEAQLTRMVGLDDGVTDALFNFSRPQTGAYFWCPPLKDSQLDLAAIGL